MADSLSPGARARNRIAGAARWVRPSLKWQSLTNPKVMAYGAVAFAVLLVFVLVPMAVALWPSPGEERHGFERDFATGLGFTATSLLAALFLLTARFQRLSM